jgi:hypothetical protein
MKPASWIEEDTGEVRRLWIAHLRHHDCRVDCKVTEAIMRVHMALEDELRKGVHAPDEDPDVALAVIRGERKGDQAYAVICLADCIRHGEYPQGWKGIGEPS